MNMGLPASAAHAWPGPTTVLASAATQVHWCYCSCRALDLSMLLVRFVCAAWVCF